ncbi:hypothetical protein PENARI_c107G09861 [Penicillium arizonense]|uniref:Uncharacterized protein n=1 Tax=Penicillium arizonense TaxID=1835702 RepID=A0A1F5L0T5_PENAI|nr:hypothetical protein PENARI_c107G09861 [Penicillium arizonense]OGE46804.1 hypothetical protein PENARI_c107G09861 [Penicillium arizonense]
MAVSQAAGFNLSNPAKDAEKYTNLSGEKIKALVWNGKNSVKVVETFKPAKVEDTDVIIKVIGSIVCGSDLHLYYSVVVELQKGDILGHEFCDVVDSLKHERAARPIIRIAWVPTRTWGRYLIKCHSQIVGPRVAVQVHRPYLHAQCYIGWASPPRTLLLRAIVERGVW